MSEDKTYNGWKGGYETWLCNLWIDNSQGDQEYVAVLAYQAYNDSSADDSCGIHFSREENAAKALAEQLKEYIEEQNPLQEAGLFSDLLNGALSEIDWREIAEHYIEDLDKSEFEEESADESD